LEKALRLQNKNEEADEIKDRLANIEISRNKEKQPNHIEERSLPRRSPLRDGFPLTP